MVASLPCPDNSNLIGLNPNALPADLPPFAQIGPMVFLLLFNFLMIMHIGLFVLPLYALSTAACLAEPQVLQQELKASKAVSHERHEVGIAG